jgi:hypothetical protein
MPTDFWESTSALTRTRPVRRHGRHGSEDERSGRGRDYSGTERRRRPVRRRRGGPQRGRKARKTRRCEKFCGWVVDDHNVVLGRKRYCRDPRFKGPKRRCWRRWTRAFTKNCRRDCRRKSPNDFPAFQIRPVQLAAISDDY